MRRTLPAQDSPCALAGKGGAHLPPERRCLPPEGRVIRGVTNNVAMLVSLVLEVTIAAWNSPQNRMPRLASCTSFCLHAGAYPSPEAASMEDAEDVHFCKAVRPLHSLCSLTSWLFTSAKQSSSSSSSSAPSCSPPFAHQPPESQSGQMSRPSERSPRPPKGPPRPSKSLQVAQGGPR